MPLLLALAAVLPESVALLLLAVIQGLTEFLPISSSGHLVLAGGAMDFASPGIVVEVALHLGTLASVLIVYRRDVLDLLRGMIRGRWREPLTILVATLPTVVVFLFLKDWIEAAFGTPVIAARGLLGTAAILVVGEQARRRMTRPPATAEDALASAPVRALDACPSLGAAIFIGCAQAVAILPGVSRSGSTIAAGLVAGLAPAAAARFSFLLAIPAILGAAVVHVPDALDARSGFDAASLLLPASVAALVGWVALRFLLSFLGRGAFAWFALYCGGLGAAYLIFA